MKIGREKRKTALVGDVEGEGDSEKGKGGRGK